MYIYIERDTYTHTCIYIHIYIHIYVCIYIHTYISMYIYICIHIHIHIQIHTHIHIHIRIYTCIFIVNLLEQVLVIVFQYRWITAVFFEFGPICSIGILLCVDLWHRFHHWVPGIDSMELQWDTETSVDIRRHPSPFNWMYTLYVVYI